MAGGEETAAIIEVLSKLNGEAKPASSQAQALELDGWKSERDALAKFCQVYHDQRCFSQQSRHSQLFQQLLHLLHQHRLTEAWLLNRAIHGDQAGHTHVMLMALRLLLRDEHFQHLLFRGVQGLGPPLLVLRELLARLVQDHFSPAPHSCDLLKETTNIFQKVSNSGAYRQPLLDAGVHSLLVQLLWSHDLVPLQCSICALINLCKTDSVCVGVAALNCATPLLHIISSYDAVSRHLAADLLLLLSQQSKLQEQVHNSDALPQCLRILRSDDLHLLHRMVGVIERLLECSDCQEEVRLLGGIPLLLGLLSNHPLGGSESRDSLEKLVALRAVCCSALTQLVLIDANAQLIVQGNGIFLIATNILPPLDSERASGRGSSSRILDTLQRYALRALRYLFSVERNRRVFKKLFPADLFEMFIDIGHYRRDLGAYSQLTHAINTLPESERAVMQSSIETTNHNKSPIFSIGGYSVLELLGSGAFGSVYKVLKQNSEQYLALKEIRCSHPALGHTDGERASSIGRLLNEVNMIREQLRHPNVVRYYRCFQEGDHVYIVMELLEGAPLCDHISSLAERGLKFSEERLWKVFMQLVLALRYLHKEKRVVHRDLSPANLMLSDEDKLTITDFGLAKQKRDLSVMKSVVGTVLYWCPELVQSEPYNEKADVWAAGCILYLLASLKPPFHSTNLLSLAKKIAEVDYVVVPEDKYSPLVNKVISKCLTADPQLRPDSVQLGAMLSGVMMAHVDSLALSNDSLERKLAKEKQKTVRHYHKAVWSERKYQQLLSTSTSSPPTAASGHVRRQLSSTFASMQSAGSTSADTAYFTPADSDVRGREFAGSDAAPTFVDPLQSSSDSVFVDSAAQDRLLGNWEQPAASPQVLVRGRGRPNPLTSHTSRRISSSGDFQFSRTPHPLGAGLQSPMATGHKSRTPSASSTLSISPKHLREISDPILVLLTQLHKLVYLTQLPPSSAPSARRTLVQAYKRGLFQPGSSGARLKTELYGLVHGGAEAVVGLGEGPQVGGARGLNVGGARGMRAELKEGGGRGVLGEGLQVGGARMVQCALQEMGEDEPDDKCTLTYETLQKILESLAVEHGYYQQTTPTSHTH